MALTSFWESGVGKMRGGLKKAPGAERPLNIDNLLINYIDWEDTVL
jgi:hypothetical protein